MASKWTPVQRRDLTDFLEQGALVTVDDYTLGVYRNGTGAKVDLPEHIRLCRLEDAPPRVELTPERVAALQFAANFIGSKADLYDLGAANHEDTLRGILAEMEGTHDEA